MSNLPPRPELPPGYRIQTRQGVFDVWLFRDAAVIGPKTRALAIERAWAHWRTSAGAWVAYLDALEKRYSHDCASDYTGRELTSESVELVDAPENATTTVVDTPEAWAEFREAGMLWLVNRTLHMFGWSIVLEVDRDTGAAVAVRPERVKYRGFSRDSEERGYARVTEWMRSNGEQLLKEVNEDG